jgi:hypothetical protein
MLSVVRKSQFKKDFKKLRSSNRDINVLKTTILKLPGLADARFADEDRIGFALLRKNPRHPENLVLPPDHRLQSVASRDVGDVSAVNRERRPLLLPDWSTTFFPRHQVETEAVAYGTSAGM